MAKKIYSFYADRDLAERAKAIAKRDNLHFSELLNRALENLIDKPEDSHLEHSDEGVGLRVQHPIVIRPVELQAELARPKSAELLRAEAELEKARFKSKWMYGKVLQWQLVQKYGSEEEQNKWQEEYHREEEEIDHPPSMYDRVMKAYRRGAW